MKLKRTFIMKIFLFYISLIFVILTISSCSLETSKEEDYLLNSQWGQTDMYAKFCPDNNRAGCWSTAIAQILYFHRVIPTGTIDYETSTGYKLSEALDSYKFDWNLFVEKIDERTSEESKDQVSKYIYFTSLVLEKDFKTGSYKTVKREYKDRISTLNVDNVISNLNRHFNCQAMDYHYTKEELETNKDAIKELIKEEIDSNRPIMLYFQGGYNGHATVIDGYLDVDDKFLVHINQGNDGWGNKWYDFNKPIIDEIDDMNHRILITIKPSVINTNYETEVLYKQDYLLETQWDKDGIYTKFSPDNETMGCWSTALAQILSYHKFQPTGEINYETSSGIKISNNLNSYKFNWDLFLERLDAMASKQSIEQVAKYNYYTEIVLEKNFGSMGYNTIIEDESNIDISEAINNLNKHFNCQAGVYKYTEEDKESSKDVIIALIKTEIDNKRPLLFYSQPSSGESYSVVIDGYSEENNELFVHINAGMDGIGNQWYKLFGSIVEMKNWIFVTVSKN